ncbi:hypothetical protein M0802_001255 [Mischocyttarus mexicanus]|nr:hypothetical protein M0802_001255 [Mischocyttarus mexicanus]
MNGELRGRGRRKGKGSKQVVRPGQCIPYNNLGMGQWVPDVYSHGMSPADPHDQNEEIAGVSYGSSGSSRDE